MPSEADLYRLFDYTPIGMFRAATDGTLRYANPAFARMLGYDSVEEVLAKNLGRDIYVDIAERKKLHAEYAPGRVVDGVRLRWKKKDGTAITVRLWGHIVESDEGPSYDGSVLDVTASDRQQAELERTATILEQVLGQMPAIYWVLDHELRLVRTGGAVQRVLGFAQDHFYGKTMEQIHSTEPGTQDAVALHRRALAGEVVQYETTYRGKLLENTVAPQRAGDGTIIGVIGTCIDVTDARLLERRMVDAQRAESLGVLAGGLAHDFNNLLVAVIGNADLALRELPGASPGRGPIESIRAAGLRAAELTNQLLTYAGRGGAGTRAVAPHDMVSELLKIIAPSVPAGVKVTVDVARDLALRGDPLQVHQVLLNLVANARDALGGHGSITIRARDHHHSGEIVIDDVLNAPPGDYVLIEVSDDGPGMDAETRRHVFEPFFTTKAKGHGLGLAAVLGIVRAHGGGLRLHTEPANGARFEILWPRAEPEVSEIAHASTGTHTVLVIDDEDLVREVLARMIEDLGYAAVTAPDGATGLRIAGSAPIDCVIVDMTMPDMNGADVISALRQRRPDLPVVVCSGYDLEGRGPVDADAFLPKPFRIEALQRTLAKLLPLRNV